VHNGKDINNYIANNIISKLGFVSFLKNLRSFSMDTWPHKIAVRVEKPVLW
jgi:hypothetical protein